MIKVDSDRRIGDPIEMGKFIPWENLQTALNRCCGQYSLPVVVEMDKLSEGGFLSGAEDCVVVYHANHKKDYFSYAITQKELYGSSYLSVFFAGVSKNWRQKNMVDISRKEQDVQSAVYKATYGEFGSMGSGVTKAFQSALKKGAEKKLVEEKLYYERLEGAILAAIDIAQHMPAPAPKASAASSAHSAPKATSVPKATAAPKAAPAAKAAAPKAAATPKTTAPLKAATAPKAAPDATKNAEGKTASGLLGWVTIVWFALAIWTFITFGAQSLLTSIPAFLALCWASNLAEKRRFFFGVLVAFIGWMAVCGPLMEFTEVLGALVPIAGALLTVFAE